MKYLGKTKAFEIMSKETLKNFNIPLSKEYYRFEQNGHTVGIPICTSETFPEVVKRAAEIMPV